MGIGFVEYPLIISSGNADLNQIWILGSIYFILQFISYIFIYTKNQAYNTDLSRYKDATYMIFRTLFQLV